MTNGSRIGQQQRTQGLNQLHQMQGGADAQLQQFAQQDPKIKDFLEKNPQVANLLKNNPALLQALMNNPDALQALQGLAATAKQSAAPQGAGQPAGDGGGGKRAEGAGGAKGGQQSGGASSSQGKSLEEMLAELMKDDKRRKEIMQKLEAQGKLTPELKAALGGDSQTPGAAVASVGGPSIGGGSIGGGSVGA